MDLQGQVNWLDLEYKTDRDGRLEDKHGGTVYSLGGEVGQRFVLERAGTLIPQAQLSWSSADLGNFRDDRGNEVDMGSSTSLLGRLGIASEFTGALFTDGQPIDADGTALPKESYYLIGNLWREFDGDSTVTIDGAAFASDASRTWGEIGLGGMVMTGARGSIYAEASYAGGSDGQSGSNSEWRVLAGWRGSF